MPRRGGFPPRPTRPITVPWDAMTWEGKETFFRTLTEYYKHLYYGPNTTDGPEKGAYLGITFTDNLTRPEICFAPPTPRPPQPPQPPGLSPIRHIDIEPAPPPPQQPLGLSPVVCIDIPALEPPPAPAPPPPALGFSPITCCETTAQTPSTKKTKTKRRKTKKTTKTSSAPVEKQAASPSPTPPTPTPDPTPTPASPAPAPSRPRNQTTRTSRPPPRPTQGIVIHGVALRKDLEKVRQWLEVDNKELDKATTGIRWLRRKTTLEEEGKKASSVVVYTKTRVEVGKVRLGGKWLRSEEYEPNRRRG